MKQVRRDSVGHKNIEEQSLTIKSVHDKQKVRNE